MENKWKKINISMPPYQIGNIHHDFILNWYINTVLYTYHIEYP